MTNAHTDSNSSSSANIPDSNKFALVSVSDKFNLDIIVPFLINNNYRIISTGGTFTTINNILEQHNLDTTKVIEVSTVTKFPELLGGRVKTLHPKIAAGILNDSKNGNHINDVNNYQIPKISVVVVNLYPFQRTIEKTDNLDTIIENIDIGGHTLIREAFKNYKDVSLLVDPNDYSNFVLRYNNLNDTEKLRFNFKLGLKGLNHITQYDMIIANYFNSIDNLERNNDTNTNFENNSISRLNNPIYRCYTPIQNLKYGCNSHQNQAMICSTQINTNIINNLNSRLNMFDTLQGNIGYINVLDAINSWNLVYELSSSLNLPPAASFKHTSPAGVGLGITLPKILEDTYGVKNEDLSVVATAFIRA